MLTMRVLVALVAGALLATSSVALAATPTQADFDACNQMAQSKIGNPSASPQTSPQTGAAKSSGAVTGSAGTQAAPSQETADKARVENQADQLRGISETSKNDPAYQQAYRDCLKSRGF